VGRIKEFSRLVVSGEGGEEQNGARRTKYAEHSISRNLSIGWVADNGSVVFANNVNKLAVFANLNS
jgi:hypothetical protein